MLVQGFARALRHQFAREVFGQRRHNKNRGASCMRREGVGRGCGSFARETQCCQGGRADAAALHSQSVPARGPCRSRDEGPIHVADFLRGFSQAMGSPLLEGKQRGARWNTQGAHLARPAVDLLQPRSTVAGMRLKKGMLIGPIREGAQSTFMRSDGSCAGKCAALQQPAQIGRDRSLSRERGSNNARENGDATPCAANKFYSS